MTSAKPVKQTGMECFGHHKSWAVNDEFTKVNSVMNIYVINTGKELMQGRGAQGGS